MPQKKYKKLFTLRDPIKYKVNIFHQTEIYCPQHWLLISAFCSTMDNLIRGSPDNKWWSAHKGHQHKSTTNTKVINTNTTNTKVINTNTQQTLQLILRKPSGENPNWFKQLSPLCEPQFCPLFSVCAAFCEESKQE